MYMHIRACGICHQSDRNDCFIDLVASYGVTSCVQVIFASEHFNPAYLLKKKRKRFHVLVACKLQALAIILEIFCDDSMIGLS